VARRPAHTDHQLLTNHLVSVAYILSSKLTETHPSFACHHAYLLFSSPRLFLNSTNLNKTRSLFSTNSTKTTSTFHGAVIDTGAERSAIGHAQATAYCNKSNVPLQLARFNARFRFADGTWLSLGKLKLVVPTLSHPLNLYIDVVAPDVPLLLGLDTMNRHQLQFLSKQMSWKA
jgi:hypothetical protein